MNKYGFWYGLYVLLLIECNNDKYYLIRNGDAGTKFIESKVEWMTIPVSTIEVQSKWGKPARYLYHKHSEGCKGLAVLFPGNRYTLIAPVMWYAYQAAFSAGYDVLGIEYGFQSNNCSIEREDIDEIVLEAILGLHRIPFSTYENIVFIGKSLGTTVASKVSQNLHSPHIQNYIFLTPLPEALAFLATVLHGLVIVGDKDQLFQKCDVVRLSKFLNVNVHIVQGASHRLEIPDDYKSSLKILYEVAHLCETFCKMTVGN